METLPLVPINGQPPVKPDQFHVAIKRLLGRYPFHSPTNYIINFRPGTHILGSRLRKKLKCTIARKLSIIEIEHIHENRYRDDSDKRI